MNHLSNRLSGLTFTLSRATFVWIILMVCASPTVMAQQIEITVSPDQDTTLYEDAADLGNGIGEHLFSGRIASGERRRAVLRFPIPALPANAIITSAALELSMTRNATATANSYSLHRLTEAWGEGASNAGDPGGAGTTAEIGDATWRHRFFNTDLWTSEGGDFDLVPSAQIELTGVARYSITGGGMVADINQWRADPASNQGWLLQVDETQGNRTARRFASRENAVLTDRPALIIQYRLPDPTAVPSLRPLALVLLTGLMMFGLWLHTHRQQARSEDFKDPEG